MSDLARSMASSSPSTASRSSRSEGAAFPVAVAQRLDIRVSLAPGPGAYPVLAQLEGERSQTGVILVAAGGPVPRIADVAETPSPALTLDLERGLRAQKPLAPRKADRIHILNLTGEMAGYVVVDQ